MSADLDRARKSRKRWTVRWHDVRGNSHTMIATGETAGDAVLLVKGTGLYMKHPAADDSLRAVRGAVRV